MVKKYFVGCRVDEQLFNKLSNHVEQNSTLVRKAIEQYFREKEPNGCIDGYGDQLINMLNIQISDLKQDKQILQQRLDYFMLPWYKRVFLPPHKK